MTHLLSVTVATDDSEDWTRVWERLNEVAQELGSRHPSATVSSHLIDDNYTDEEYFDEYTMLKVMDALDGVGYNEYSVRSIINALLEAGILFRERGPREANRSDSGSAADSPPGDGS